MINKARKSLEKLCSMATYKGGNDEEIRVSNYNSHIIQALDQAEKNETILHVLRLHLKNKVRVQRFFQAYVLIINDGDTIINLNENEYNALKEWLEDEDY